MHEKKTQKIYKLTVKTSESDSVLAINMKGISRGNTKHG